jgi:prepilin-type N-terminal cleavage/methylation domain-containing protein
MRTRRPHPRAFTLIETLIVVAIIGILVGVILPAVQRAREAGNRVTCQNNLKQIALALHNYHDITGQFPPAILEMQRPPKARWQWVSWLARILPYVEQPGLYRDMEDAYASQGAAPDPWKSPPHHALSKVVPVYRCPSDDRQYVATYAAGLSVAFTGYLGVNGADLRSHDGVLYWNSAVRMSDVSDGASNTLAVGERPPSWDLMYGWWYAGAGQWEKHNGVRRNTGSSDVTLGGAELNARTSGIPQMDACPPGPYKFGPGRALDPCDQFHFWSMHDGGSFFALADGSVRFLNYGAAPVLAALATRNKGESAVVN